MVASAQSVLRASVIAPIQTWPAVCSPSCAVNTEPRGVVNCGIIRPTSAGVIGPYLNLGAPRRPFSTGMSPVQPALFAGVEPGGQSIVRNEPRPQAVLE